METLGSLFDKLSIEKIRLENTKKIPSLPNEMIVGIEKKIGLLKSELDEYVHKAISGQVQLEDPKFKIYKNEKPSEDRFEHISEAITKLFDANYTLWNLEDKRRDKSLSDTERLKACDDVGKWNRTRNDAMDSVNSIFKHLINKSTS